MTIKPSEGSGFFSVAVSVTFPVAPASMAFSSSSFSALEGRCETRHAGRWVAGGADVGDDPNRVPRGQWGS